MLRQDRGHNGAKGNPDANPEAASLAALALGESLVYMMVEEGLMDKDTVQDALEDAIDSQRLLGERGGSGAHEVASRLLERIMDALEFTDPHNAPDRG